MQTPTVQLTSADVHQAKLFAEQVVNETYDRFQQGYQERIDRIYFGKVGEVAFLKYLISQNIYPDTTGMFEIYKGITNVDKFDFFTLRGESIDIKTAYKSFHIRILIPYDQFENGKAKDYYVGVYFDTTTLLATIYGYTTKEELLANGKKNFGEGDAYWAFLRNLHPIKNLLILFR